MSQWFSGRKSSKAQQFDNFLTYHHSTIFQETTFLVYQDNSFNLQLQNFIYP